MRKERLVDKRNITPGGGSVARNRRLRGMEATHAKNYCGAFVFFSTVRE
jgi:hypothetical protein